LSDEAADPPRLYADQTVPASHCRLNRDGRGLNRDAVPTAQGVRAWSQATVRALLMRKAFIDHAIAVGQGVLVGFI
jgi:hypothetical protein